MFVRRWLLPIFLAALCGSANLPAGTDEGAAQYVPWSGSFWPIREGRLIRGPLAKYDRATGHQAAMWEWQSNPPGPAVPHWFGYCHAWAAAAVMDREPVRLRGVVGRNGEPIQLGIGDQKGMLTACHTNDVAQHYGFRYNGAPGEDRNDIYPDELWRVLRLYVRQQGVPLILDIEAGQQVWNFPVYAYRVRYQPTGRGAEQMAQMSIWLADDAVPADYLGIRVAKQTYYFTFHLHGGVAVTGSGQWTGPSIRNHPDFAWFPQVPVANNPEVRYATVKRLVDASGSGPSRPPLPPNIIPRSHHAPRDEPSANDVVTSRAHHAERDGYIPISPVELLSVVVNKTSAFDFDVTVDKFDGGHYTVGEPFSITGTSARAGFLYLLYLDRDGQLWPLYPPPGVDNRIPTQQRFRLPPANVGPVFRTTGPPGTHRIKAIVTAAPLGLPGLAAVEAGESSPQEFRLPPSQREHFEDVLVRYQQAKSIGPDDLGDAAPVDFLGEFAQDEVAFYVGPVTERREP